MQNGSTISEPRVIVHSHSNQTTEVLKGSGNWSEWRLEMKTRFELDDLWDCIAGNCEDPVKQKNARCRLILSIDKKLRVHIEDMTSAKDIWRKLQNLYQDSGLDRRIGLLQKLCSIQLVDYKSVEEYVSDIVSTAHKLNNIGFNVGDEWVGSLLLKGLPENYKPMIMSIGSSGVSISADKIKMKILQDVTIDKEASKDSALISAKFKKFKKKGKVIGPGKSGESKTTCYNCGGVGHISTNCSSVKKDQGRKSNENKSLFTALSAGFRSNEWIIDSGASAHMSKSLENFNRINEFKGKIRIADNNLLNAFGKGDVNLRFQDQGTVVIKDVLHVPDLAVNLLSISEITGKDKRVVFQEDKCHVYNKNDDILATARLIDGMYVLNQEKEESLVYASGKKDNFNIWHRRLGHLNQESLMLLKKEMSTGK